MYPNFKDKAIDLNNYNFQENPKKLPDDFLQGRDFSNLDFTGADFTGADFTGADFTGAIVKPEQLAKAKSLCNTTLPNSISDQEIKKRINGDCRDKNKRK